jgi:CPA1 family monovalent cation:H+ antiporter
VAACSPEHLNLFSIASLVAIIARRAHLRYSIALVVVGLGVGALELVEAPHLMKEPLVAVLFPGLVFEAAHNIHTSELRAMWRTIGVPMRGLVARLGVGGLAPHASNGQIAGYTT